MSLPWRSVTIRGSAVPTTVWSSAARNRPRRTAKKICIRTRGSTAAGAGITRAPPSDDACLGALALIGEVQATRAQALPSGLGPRTPLTNPQASPSKTSCSLLRFVLGWVRVRSAPTADDRSVQAPRSRVHEGRITEVEPDRLHQPEGDARREDVGRRQD